MVESNSSSPMRVALVGSRTRAWCAMSGSNIPSYAGRPATSSCPLSSFVATGPPSRRCGVRAHAKPRGPAYTAATKTVDLHSRLVTAFETTVRLEGLVRRFSGATACDAMSWSEPAGAVTAVLGPNGAGKTTAVECAVGLQRPDAGSVTVLDIDPWRAGPEHRARVGVMLQSGGLPTGTTPSRL